MSFTNQEASIILGMIARGDKQHDIAAYFGENQARIKEVHAGSHGGSVTAAPASELPPRGAVGPKARRLRSLVQKAITALDDGDVETAKKHLTMGAAIFDKHEA